MWNYDCKSYYAAYNENLVNAGYANKFHSNFKKDCLQAIIICVLSARQRLRYSEIRREMYNITDAVLAATLKDLIEDGIVDRKSYDEIPPKVEYSLTSKVKSVIPILQSICQWSDVFYKEDGENEMVQCQKCDYHR